MIPKFRVWDDVKKAMSEVQVMKNREVAKIRFEDNEYDVHTVKLTKNDIKNLKNGTTLMYFNEEAGQVIAISMEATND